MRRDVPGARVLSVGIYVSSHVCMKTSTRVYIRTDDPCGSAESDYFSLLSEVHRRQKTAGRTSAVAFLSVRELRKDSRNRREADSEPKAPFMRTSADNGEDREIMEEETWEYFRSSGYSRRADNFLRDSAVSDQRGYPLLRSHH